MLIFISIVFLPVENVDIDEAAGVAKGRLVEEEERDLGAVAWPVYWAYVKACTVILTILAVLLQVC